MTTAKEVADALVFHPKGEDRDELAKTTAVRPMGASEDIAFFQICLDDPKHEDRSGIFTVLVRKIA